MHYDLRLKLIFQDAMPGLLRLLNLPAVLEYLTVGFPKRSKALPDFVVRLVDGRILHLELQSKNDPRIEWRCLEYWQVISEQWPDAEVIQVIIYAGDSPLKMANGIKRGRLTYGFDIVDLQQVAANTFLESAGDNERMLAALCHSDDPRATIRTILASWKHLSAKDIRDKLANLSVLSQLRKHDTIVKEESAIMPIEIDIRENAFVKWGEEMGEARGEGKLLTKILERRFGPIPEDVRVRISTANAETIETWAENLESARTLTDIFGLDASSHRY